MVSIHTVSVQMVGVECTCGEYGHSECDRICLYTIYHAVSEDSSPNYRGPSEVEDECTSIFVGRQLVAH